MGGTAAIRAIADKLRVDGFIVMIFVVVGIATLLPASGAGAVFFSRTTTIAVGMLFFLYGARLSPSEVLRGLGNWRLHLTITVTTFVLFPLLGLTARVLVPTVLSQPLYIGVLYLCTLPSTVQSSIAFTSIARGNVAAAVCSASLSNLIGILVTPLLVASLMSGHGSGFSVSSVTAIVVQLLVPFMAGQLLRRWIAGWIKRHGAALRLIDRGSILLVVYTAFSEGVTRGIWHQLTVAGFGLLVAVCCALLGLVLVITSFASRQFGFFRADRIAIVFCGSKKSLASGLPMATVLFAGQNLGLIVLPLMLFHQLQLMACAWLARRYRATANGLRPTDHLAQTAW